MELTPHETVELAAFLAKRFPSYRHRGNLADAAGLPFDESSETDPTEAWMKMLRTARLRRRLGRLITVCARCDLADENLQTLAATLGAQGDRGASRARTAVGVGLSVAAGALIAVGLSQWMPAAQVDVIETSPAQVTPAASPIIQALQAGDASHERSDAPGAAGAGEPAGPAEDETLDPALNLVSVVSGRGMTRSYRTPPESPPEPVTPARANGRCTLEEGGLIGYWYAGVETPGGDGDTITMAKSVFVRSDYPDRHNGFDARSPSRCVLKEGDRVRLSAPPILVPGERYWVPISSGDLVGPAQ